MTRIAVDARPLIGPRTGAGTYLKGLVEALVDLPGDELYILVSPKPIRLGPFLAGSQRVRVEIDRGLPGSIWIQTTLRRTLRRVRADLFHASLYVAPLVGRPCPTVVTVFDMSYLAVPGTLATHNRWILRIFAPPSARQAGHVIGISEWTRREIVGRLGLSPDKVSTVHPGVEDRFFTKDGAVGAAEVGRRLGLTRPYILYLGTIEPRKKLLTLLDAFRILQDEGRTELDLVLAGQRGWACRDVYRRADTERLRGRVRFPGYVPADLLPGLYRGTKLFVYPSLYEGFGFPPLEAMASGTPVVVSEGSSLAEVVGDAGVSVPAGNAGDLASGMARLLDEPDLRGRCIRKGRGRARAFRWEATARQTLGIYRKVLGGG